MTFNPNNNIVLITESYPFGAVAESFLDFELPYLSKIFDSVVIVPRSFPRDIERVKRVLPANVSVNTSLQSRNPLKIPFKIIISTFAMEKINYLLREIFRRPQTLIEIPSLIRFIVYLYNAFRVQRWTLHYIEQSDIDLTKTIFYTYWMDSATMGISIAKKKNCMIKFVCRAHRGDLYEEEIQPHYLPFRYETTSADRIYLISNHGETYLVKRYPTLKSKCMVSRLGVKDPGFVCKSSTDGILRIVSCSYIIPAKRIHLIILALKELGLQRQELKIEWTHIGYGPLQKQMEKFALLQLSKNIISKFLGYLPGSPVSEYYNKYPIDVFINVSASEGIPVSIMEAQSCGIPVIATAVGGTPEIVSERVGFLISESPSLNEIADALGFFVDNPEITQKMRVNSIANWNNLFDADKNFTEFAKSLMMI